MSLLDEAHDKYGKSYQKGRAVDRWAASAGIDRDELVELAEDRTLTHVAVWRTLRDHGYPGSTSSVQDWRRDVLAR